MSSPSAAHGLPAGRTVSNSGGDEPPIDRAVIAGFVRRQWLFILLVFLGTIAGTCVVLNLMTEQYETESKILVRLGRENVDPPAMVRGQVLVTGVRLQDTQNEIQILESSELIGRVVDEIGLDAFREKPRLPTSLIGWVKHHVRRAANGAKRWYEEVLIAMDLKKRLGDRERAVETVREGTTVELQKDSDVIAVRTRLPDYTISEKIQSRLLALYLEHRGRVRRDTGVQEFLDDRVRQVRASLDALEAQRDNLKRTRSISSAQEQQSLLLRQIRELTGAAIQTQTDMAALERQSEELKKQLAQTPKDLRSSEQEIPNPLAVSLRERLATLRTHLSSMLTKYQPESVVVANVRKEISDLEGQLGTERGTTTGAVTYQLNPLRQSVEARLQETTVNLEGLRSRLRQQEMALGKIRNELKEVDESYPKLTDLERARQITEENYLALMKRRQTAQIDSDLMTSRISNVSVLQGPFSFPRPVSPRKLLIFYVSLGVGAVLGILLGLLMDYLDCHVHDPKRAELLLQLPCLGIVECQAEVSRTGA